MATKSKKALAWHAKNKWFGKNIVKTRHALIMHEILIEIGIKPTTIQYFNLIDKYMEHLNYFRLDKNA
jgi:hypothetical protein